MAGSESEFIRRAITLDNYTTCVHTDAAAVRQKRNKIKEEEKGGKMLFRAQELCEGRGGLPGLPSLLSLRFLWT